MKTINYFLIFSATLFMISCDSLIGEEVARIKDNKVSSPENLDWKTIELDLINGDKLHFWTEMDMTYEGDLALRYQIQIIHETDTLGFIELDPMDKNITIGEIRTEIMNKTNWKYSGRMKSFDIEDDGYYTFRAILVSSPNETLELKKADFIIKK